jgi:hypothetical protein
MPEFKNDKGNGSTLHNKVPCDLYRSSHTVRAMKDWSLLYAWHMDVV